MADNNNNPSMADDRGVVVGRDAAVEFWKPLQWTAIVGGMVTALGVQLILTLIGVGIGMAAADPYSYNSMSRGDDDAGLGIGAAIWLIVSGMISFGVGGWVAGYMSGVLRTGSGALHGVAAWALAAVFGATVTALAGSPVLGGAAASVGPAARAYATYDTRNAGAGMGAGAGDSRPLASGEVASARGTVTEEEVTRRAEQAREALASASLWTGVAFLLSMIAAGVGGTVARNAPSNAVRVSRSGRSMGGTPAPAI